MSPHSHLRTIFTLFSPKQKTSNWAYEAAVEKAVNNIASNINNIDDPYTVSIAAYALQLANHPQKAQVLEKLLKKSISTGNSSNIHFVLYNMNNYISSLHSLEQVN